jgi:hypothetical protein
MSECMLINTFGFDFRITRLIDDRLYASMMEVSLDLDFDDQQDRNLQARHLRTMKRWIEDILDGSVAFSVHNSLNTELFGHISNNTMFCPDEPQDHLLLLLIMSKLNAIGQGCISVRSGNIHSDTNQGFGTTVVGDPLELLPSAEDWMGKARYWDQPWWNRPDGGMMDIPSETGEDLNIKPDILINIDHDRSTGLIATDDVVDPIGEGAAEIIRPDFRSKKQKKRSDD